MIEIKNKEDCCGCYSCFNICPQNCISMQEDEEGFNYPVVNQNICIKCGLCESSCPILNRQIKKYVPKAVLGYRDSNEISLFESSSGGFFGTIAEFIITNDGYVAAAYFNDNNEVIHGITNNLSELYKFKKSKYVQSSINKLFVEIKKFLSEGRKVLFVGTPCQTAGLLKYLRKVYENLFIVDFVCHGVPSPGIWRNYLKSLGENISEINFRDKSTGWPSYSFSYKKDDIKYTTLSFKNHYFRGFIYNLYLRPSCYKCKFKNFSSGSDITISDFWGVWKNYPEWNDNRGASCIAVNTEKGDIIIQEIKKNNSNFINVNYDDAYVKYNNSATEATTYTKKREVFFSQYNENNFELLVDKLTKDSFFFRIKNYLHNFLYKKRKA